MSMATIAELFERAGWPKGPIDPVRKDWVHGPVDVDGCYLFAIGSDGKLRCAPSVRRQIALALSSLQPLAAAAEDVLHMRRGSRTWLKAELTQLRARLEEMGK